MIPVLILHHPAHIILFSLSHFPVKLTSGLSGLEKGFCMLNMYMYFLYCFCSCYINILFLVKKNKNKNFSVKEGWCFLLKCHIVFDRG